MAQSTAPRRIVLTGVSRGLGRALVETWLNAPPNEGPLQIFGCARNTEAIGELQAKFRGHCFTVVDVADEQSVAGWANEVLATGSPDLLINNAALIHRNAPLWEISADEFDPVVDVNVKGVANVIRHFVPAMVARRAGVIVNLSSGWGRSVAAEVAPYCATKWAIEGLTRALAEELPAHMAAIPLNPGIIDTEMLRSCFGSNAGSYPDARRWAESAADFLLSLGPEHNGQSLTVPL